MLLGNMEISTKVEAYQFEEVGYKLRRTIVFYGTNTHKWFAVLKRLKAWSQAWSSLFSKKTLLSIFPLKTFQDLINLQGWMQSWEKQTEKTHKDSKKYVYFRK